jgi:hypothetical protein
MISLPDGERSSLRQSNGGKMKPKSESKLKRFSLHLFTSHGIDKEHRDRLEDAEAIFERTPGKIHLIDNKMRCVMRKRDI